MPWTILKRSKLFFFVCVQSGIPSGHMGLDIGPQSREAFAKVIKGSNLIVWNGPLGVAQKRAFAGGTKVRISQVPSQLVFIIMIYNALLVLCLQAVLEAVAEATSKGATSIICGSDTVCRVVR